MKQSFLLRLALAVLLCIGSMGAWAQGNVTYQDGWPRPNYRVNDMVLSDGVLYFVGSFTRVGNVQRNGGAAIDVATGTLLPWNPNVHVDTVVQGIGPSTVAKKGDTIFLGGYFTQLGGQPCNSFGAVNATTGARLAWDPGFATTNNYPYVSIFTLLVNDNTLYVGGAFDSVGGVHRKGFAALNATTGVLLPFNANIGGSGNIFGLDIVKGSNALYLCGSFNNVGGQTRQRVASVDPVTGAVSSWNPMGYGGYTEYGALHIAVKDNTVYIGGVFYYIQGVQRTHLCAVNATTGALLPWNPIPEAPIDAIVPIGNIVYLGGRFTGMGSPVQTRWRAAAVDATTGALKSWNPNAYGPVYSIIPNGNSVYLGGLIYYMSGDSSRKHLVAVSKQSDIIAGATAASPSSGCGPGFTTNLSLNGTSGADSFQWQRSPNDVTWTDIAGATSSTYSLYVTDSTWFRCRLRSAGTQDDYSNKVWVRVMKPVPTVSFDVPSLICLNEDAFFIATGTNLGTSPAYQWYFKGSLVSTNYYYISPRIDAVTPEELYVVVNNINATCATSTSVESEHKMLTSLPSPDRNTTFTTTSGSNKLCEGDTITFTSKASLSPNSVGASYEWYSNYDVVGTGPSYTTTVPGGYSLAVTFANGCGRTSPERFITAMPVVTADASLGNSTEICVGGATQLVATNIDGATYRWKLNGSSKGTNYYQAATMPGVYSVIATLNGCASNPATVTVTQRIVDVSTNTTGSISLCTPDSITISAVSDWAYNYQWYLGSAQIAGATNESYTATTSGSYRVGITDYHCWGVPEKKSTATVVTATPTPVASVALLTKKPAYWTLRGYPTTAGYTYQWYRNDTLIADSVRRDLVVAKNGSYTLVATKGMCTSAVSAPYVVNSATFSTAGARTIAGITEEEILVNVFPNPSTGVFYIGSEEPVNVVVKDVQGRVVMDVRNVSNIDLTAQAPGMYMMSITDASGKLLQVERVVKQ
jgi:hypothetical protein